MGLFVRMHFRFCRHEVLGKRLNTPEMRSLETENGAALHGSVCLSSSSYTRSNTAKKKKKKDDYDDVGLRSPVTRGEKKEFDRGMRQY